jgi:hypothetical protein
MAMKTGSLVVIAICAIAGVVLIMRMEAGIGSNLNNTAQLRQGLDETHWQLEQLKTAMAEDRAALHGISAAIAELQDGRSRPPEPMPTNPSAEPEPPEPEKSAPAESRRERATTRERVAGGRDMVPLVIVMPKPMFVGTPKNIVSAHLEPATDRKRPSFLVPRGVTNVARGKRVIASDNEPIIGELQMITDGDKEGADGSFVEFGPGVQWVEIDLGAPQEIFAVVVWHYHTQPRVYKDVIVCVSDDPEFAQGVKTIYNNDQDGSAKLGAGTDFEYIETNEGRLIDAKGVVGRFVRLYSNGNTSNDMNHYVEVEVYGRLAK